MARIEPSRSRHACNNQLRTIQRGPGAWLNVIVNGASSMMVGWGSVISNETFMYVKKRFFRAPAFAANKTKTTKLSMRSYLASFLEEYWISNVSCLFWRWLIAGEVEGVVHRRDHWEGHCQLVRGHTWWLGASPGALPRSPQPRPPGEEITNTSVLARRLPYGASMALA